MFFFGIVHHRSRALAFMSDPAAAQEHGVYAAVIDREAVQSLAEADIFAYEAPLIAGPTTQINVNRLRNIITETRRKKKVITGPLRSRLYKSSLTNSRRQSIRSLACLGLFAAWHPNHRVCKRVYPYANHRTQRNVVFTLVSCKRSADSFD